MLESGLPGRPKTSVEPRRPNHSGLPAPEHLLDAAGLERRLDVVVRADGHAAGDDQHVAGQAGLDRGAGGLEVVADDAVVDDVRAGALGQQPHHQPV